VTRPTTRLRALARPPSRNDLGIFFTHSRALISSTPSQNTLIKSFSQDLFPTLSVTPPPATPTPLIYHPSPPPPTPEIVVLRRENFQLSARITELEQSNVDLIQQNGLLIEHIDQLKLTNKNQTSTVSAFLLMPPHSQSSSVVTHQLSRCSTRLRVLHASHAPHSQTKMKSMRVSQMSCLLLNGHSFRLRRARDRETLWMPLPSVLPARHPPASSAGLTPRSSLRLDSQRLLYLHPPLQHHRQPAPLLQQTA
jgi:hypothetical protein